MEEKKLDKTPDMIDPDKMKSVMEDMMKARKEYEEKYAGLFRWRTGERFFVTVMKEFKPEEYDEDTLAYYGPRIMSYVLNFNDHKWCIHKGQLVLEKEGYVGKVISIEIR